MQHHIFQFRHTNKSTDDVHIAADIVLVCMNDSGRWWLRVEKRRRVDASRDKRNPPNGGPTQPGGEVETYCRDQCVFWSAQPSPMPMDLSFLPKQHNLKSNNSFLLGRLAHFGIQLILNSNPIAEKQSTVSGLCLCRETNRNVLLPFGILEQLADNPSTHTQFPARKEHRLLPTTA
jgi:hypothetical protein